MKAKRIILLHTELPIVVDLCTFIVNHSEWEQIKNNKGSLSVFVLLLIDKLHSS